MDWLGFHEPISAWTHGLWMVFAFPATWVLLRKNRGRPLTQAGLFLFGTSLVICFGGSFLFHSAPESPLRDAFKVVDHLGIFILIAGTATPIALDVLRGPWRLSLLLMIWSLAVTGVVLRLAVTPPPWLAPYLYTSFYLLMGWVGAATYFELARRLTHAGLRSLWVGGLFYSVGAVFHVTGWPDLVPGVFAHHELFHVFVMAGAACHYYFMLQVLTPYVERLAATDVPAPVEALSLPPLPDDAGLEAARPGE